MEGKWEKCGLFGRNMVFMGIESHFIIPRGGGPVDGGGHIMLQNNFETF